MKYSEPEISIILPCLNEENGLRFCLPRILQIIQEQNLSAEVLVVDNASTDQSRSVAEQFPSVRIIEEKERGYGSACLAGLKAARGTSLVLADCDGSYDFAQIPMFHERLIQGYDFVIGNRFAGLMSHNAMPWAHRYIGNPILSGTLRFFFHSSIHDSHCGLRAMTRQAFQRLNLRTIGMEFASEMIIKIEKLGLKIAEVPVNYNLRIGQSKLKSFSDGWRHLRFMLLYSPLFLFFFPGSVLFMAGIFGFFLSYFELIGIGTVRFQEHPLFVFALLTITGYQLIVFAVFAKTYAMTHLGESSALEKLYRHMTIERGAITGCVFAAVGTGIYFGILQKWILLRFGPLNEIKNAILGLMLITVGIQTFFSSFMLSILGIKEKHSSL